MQIVTVDLSADPIATCDIEVPLRRLACSSDRLGAARWDKLLELVQILRGEESNPAKVGGVILGKQLCLSGGNPTKQVCVNVWMDAPDHGPLRDGLPDFYYRLQIHRPSSPLSTDARIEGAAEAARLIQQVLGKIE